MTHVGFRFNFILGWSQQTRGAWFRWKSLFVEAAGQSYVDVHKKTFKPKFPMLPVLSSYYSPAPDFFWDKFPVNNLDFAVTDINVETLDKLSLQLGTDDPVRLLRVRNMLVNGANIGCVGHFRAGSFSSNAKHAYDFGPEVSDAIAGWVTSGYAFGPVENQTYRQKLKSVALWSKLNPMVPRA